MKRALGSFTGSVLGVLIVVAIAALPVAVVLWLGSALSVPWAITAHVWLYVAIRGVVERANILLPPWAWFLMFTLAWLAFLDVHVRALVRDELSKQRNSERSRM